MVFCGHGKSRSMRVISLVVPSSGDSTTKFLTLEFLQFKLPLDAQRCRDLILPFAVCKGLLETEKHGKGSMRQKRLGTFGVAEQCDVNIHSSDVVESQTQNLESLKTYHVEGLIHNKSNEAHSPIGMVWKFGCGIFERVVPVQVSSLSPDRDSELLIPLLVFFLMPRNATSVNNESLVPLVR
ncbi:hypothetical protein TNCV_1675561 [Trichonephila clavipes]|nr:hypothetical protein TNCV_1675561 [Trichonephila clavipes]